jgi:hypothetical protein
VKQPVILGALLLVMASPAAAQQGTAFGARVGVNFANLSFDPDQDVDTSSRTAITVGGFATIPINPRFAFQPELLYSEQGAKAVDELGSAGTFKINYVIVPLLANIGLSGGPNRVSLLVGPQVGFRTSAKAKAEDSEIDLDEDIESTDFGLVAGIAANISNFVVDARYTHGLSNMNAHDDEDQKIKNRVFTISVGISFR